MAKRRILEETIAAASNRRRFMSTIAVASAGVTAMGAGLKMEAQTSAAPTDADILNFALNLEYLEAEFYTVATTGMTIDQMGIGITGTGTQGAATGGKKVDLTNSSFPTPVHCGRDSKRRALACNIDPTGPDCSGRATYRSACHQSRTHWASDSRVLPSF